MSSCVGFTSLPVFGIVSVLDFGHFNGCVVVFLFLFLIKYGSCTVLHKLQVRYSESQFFKGYTPFMVV